MECFCIFIYYLLANWYFISSLPVETKYPHIPPIKALEFMKKFGYLEEDSSNSGALYTEEGISEAVKIVQKYGAIPETGILDNATLKLMTTPRCGVPDIIKRKRSKRFVFASNGWNKRRITYFLANWSSRLGENVVYKNIQLALDTWAKYGRLRFNRVYSPKADIIVAFGRGPHGDRFPFDGPGNVLAHAFFPYEESDYAGDIHFDDEENWADRKNDHSEEGTDFFTVALHELGHSLGLAHSSVPTSVMFPYYREYDPYSQFNLDYDDILGMYELYIRRNINDSNTSPFDEADEATTTTPTEPISTDKKITTLSPTINYDGDDETIEDHKNHDKNHGIPSTNSPSFPDICNGYFDAVATLRDELFFFKDQYIWRLKDKNQLQNGYPIPLYQMFPKLPKTEKKIDAAYERPDGMIILFTKNKYWVYDGSEFIEDSPRPLSDYNLPNNLDSIDAVQIWGRNSKTYIYKRDRFWRYNETTKEMDEGYPKHMERWRGVPENLDAATTWKDGYTYFFKGSLFWKFDNEWIIVSDNYPLPSPQIWLGCPEDEKKMIQLLYNETIY